MRRLLGPGYVVDHIVPLDAKAKDKLERTGCEQDDENTRG